VALVVLRNGGSGRVDPPGVAVSLRRGQVMDHVAENGTGRLETKGRGVADVEPQDAVPLGLKPFCLNEDRAAHVVADVLELGGLPNGSHTFTLASGGAGWHPYWPRKQVSRSRRCRRPNCTEARLISTRDHGPGQFPMQDRRPRPGVGETPPTSTPCDRRDAVYQSLAARLMTDRGGYLSTAWSFVRSQGLA